jgi:hypothetical protein
MTDQLPPGFQVDPALSQQMGTTVAVNPATGKRIRWKGATVPQGATARPEYGGNAYEAPDGSILMPTKSGGVQVIKGGQSVGAENRTRLALSLDPMIKAQVRMTASEKSGVNPYNRDWGARMLEAIPFDGGAVARTVGGQDYQDYEQAARTYEASIMPLFSGAAVSPSEAQRMIRADLPQMGDTPETLRKKAENRQMRITEAAKLMGRDDPFAPGASEDNPIDLSKGQPRSGIARKTFYRDPQGNVRRNDNGDAGNPITRPSMTGGGKPKPNDLKSKYGLE